MKATEITVLEEVELNNPIFIEALPGVGHVGKLVADHMIDELDATKFAEIYSPTFPPQVLVGEDGKIENMINELYYIRDLGENNQDIIIIGGNTQSLSPDGQYIVCSEILEFLEPFNISRIFTLGGVPTGQPVEDPRVLGAASDEAHIELLKEVGVEMRSNDGGIVGASGLFLGLGMRKGIYGACLMGETPGYFIDAESAEGVLLKLADLLNKCGYNVTQATVSRDIKELKLIKTLSDDGKHIYALSSAQKSDIGSSLDSLFSTSVISVANAQNIVVIKTIPGMAQAVCASIDASQLIGIVGSIAGEDTIFLLPKMQTGKREDR